MAGLCDTCAFHQEVRNTRGSSFSLCTRSREDPAYPRYPRLPVLSCAGYEPSGDAEDAASSSLPSRLVAERGGVLAERTSSPKCPLSWPTRAMEKRRTTALSAPRLLAVCALVGLVAMGLPAGNGAAAVRRGGARRRSPRTLSASPAGASTCTRREWCSGQRMGQRSCMCACRRREAFIGSRTPTRPPPPKISSRRAISSASCATMAPLLPRRLRRTDGAPRAQSLHGVLGPRRLRRRGGELPTGSRRLGRANW